MGKQPFLPDLTACFLSEFPTMTYFFESTQVGPSSHGPVTVIQKKPNSRIGPRAGLMKGAVVKKAIAAPFLDVTTEG